MEKLKNHKESNPFKVPENYFAELNDRILANCSETNISGVRSWGIISIKPFLTLAAIISGAALLTLALIKTIPSTSTKKENFAEALSVADDHAYDEIDLFIIESAIIEMPMQVEPRGEFSDDEIIEYLLTEQVDLSLLYEHFGDGVEL